MLNLLKKNEKSIWIWQTWIVFNGFFVLTQWRSIQKDHVKLLPCNLSTFMVSICLWKEIIRSIYPYKEDQSSTLIRYTMFIDFQYRRKNLRYKMKLIKKFQRYNSIRPTMKNPSNNRNIAFWSLYIYFFFRITYQCQTVRV